MGAAGILPAALRTQALGRERVRMATVDLFRLMSLPRLDHEPLYRSLATAIRECISAGLLRPGDHLPTRPELARALNISIGTVDRACQMLLRDRTLVQVPSKRAVVSVPPGPEEAEQTLLGTVKEIRDVQGGVLVRLALVKGQELAIRTTRSATELFGIEAGGNATASIRSSHVGLGPRDRGPR
jgi:molybdopterin-binding protein